MKVKSKWAGHIIVLNWTIRKVIYGLQSTFFVITLDIREMCRKIEMLRTNDKFRRKKKERRVSYRAFKVISIDDKLRDSCLK